MRRLKGLSAYWVIRVIDVNHHHSNQRRLFFALWPDDKVRDDIFRRFNQVSQSRFSGRQLHKNNLHLTLHFIGNVSAQKFDCVASAADEINAKSFQFRLDHFGSFAKAQVFWDGVSVIPEGLSQLHKLLGHSLTKCDYFPEIRAFTPHVTLMRKFKSREVLMPHEPVIWQVNQFALVESVSVEGGVEYRPLRFYDLV